MNIHVDIEHVVRRDGEYLMGRLTATVTATVRDLAVTVEGQQIVLAHHEIRVAVNAAIKAALGGI